MDNSTAFKNTGKHINGVNSFTATGHATVAGTASTDTVTYQLDIAYTKKGEQYAVYVYRGSSNAQTFAIPNITLTNAQSYYIYGWYIVTITDNKGKVTLRQQAGAFTVANLDAYTPPTIANLSAERYSIRPSDTGGADILTTDNGGQYVRFSFTLKPATTSISNNTWTLNIVGKSDSGETKVKNSAYTGTSSLTKAKDTAIFPAATFSFTPRENWTFTFTITDKATSTSYVCAVAKADSIMDIEATGVAIGTFVGSGGATNNNNLLINSNFTKNQESWVAWDAPTTCQVVEVGGRPWVHLVSTGSAYQGWQQDAGTKIIAGAQYTFSARVKGAKANQNFSVGIHWLDASKAIKTQSWQNFTVGTSETVVHTTFTAGAGTATFRLMAGTNQATVTDVYFTDLKLESGNIAAPVWSPSAKDMAEVAPFNKPKRFEVADDCGAIFRGGIWDGMGYRFDYVNNTMLMEYPEGFAPYAAGEETYSPNRVPMVSRVGPIVFLEGALRVTKERQIRDDIVLCTLPSWARPRVMISTIGQGSVYNIFWIRIETNGEVILSRYRNGSTYPTVPVDAQLMFTTSWLAKDACPPLPEVK